MSKLLPSPSIKERLDRRFVVIVPHRLVKEMRHLVKGDPIDVLGSKPIPTPKKGKRK